jgi:hypothetical protein
MKHKNKLINQIHLIIANSKVRIIRSVDSERAIMYWQICKAIFKDQKQGNERAKYGKFLIKSLSKELEPTYGSGFSTRQLETFKQFFRGFPNTDTLRSQFNWTQYKALIKIDNEDKKSILYY